jgi:hemoglobin
MTWRQTLGMLGTVVVLEAGCASRDSAMMEKKPLYDRLGGKPAITAVVDDFIGNVAGDTRINRRFVDANIPQLKTMLVDQICQATGGPCTYKGQTMKAAHQGMKIAMPSSPPSWRTWSRAWTSSRWGPGRRTSCSAPWVA